MLICPIATKIYVEPIVKTQLLNYTKYFCNVETLPFAGAVNSRLALYIEKGSKMPVNTEHILQNFVQIAKQADKSGLNMKFF